MRPLPRFYGDSVVQDRARARGGVFSIERHRVIVDFSVIDTTKPAGRVRNNQLMVLIQWRTKIKPLRKSCSTLDKRQACAEIPWMKYLIELTHEVRHLERTRRHQPRRMCYE